MASLLETLLVTVVVGGVSVTGFDAIEQLDQSVQSIVLPAAFDEAASCAKEFMVIHGYPSEYEGALALAQGDDEALKRDVVGCYMNITGDPYDSTAGIPQEVLDDLHIQTAKTGG
jgi:hypothetical protein